MSSDNTVYFPHSARTEVLVSNGLLDVEMLRIYVDGPRSPRRLGRRQTFLCSADSRTPYKVFKEGVAKRFRVAAVSLHFRGRLGARLPIKLRDYEPIGLALGKRVQPNNSNKDDRDHDGTVWLVAQRTSVLLSEIDSYRPKSRQEQELDELVRIATTTTTKEEAQPRAATADLDTANVVGSITMHGTYTRQLNIHTTFFGWLG